MRSLAIKTCLIALALAGLAACTSYNAAPNLNPNQMPYEHIQQGHTHGW